MSRDEDWTERLRRWNAQKPTETRWLAPLAAAIFASFVIGAHLATLPNLPPHDDWDGTNNALQLPLALPWLVLVPASSSHTVDAFVLAGLGFVNVGLLYAWLRYAYRRTRVN